MLWLTLWPLTWVLPCCPIKICEFCEEGRKVGRKKGRKEGRKEERKKTGKEGMEERRMEK